MESQFVVAHQCYRASSLSRQNFASSPVATIKFILQIVEFAVSVRAPTATASMNQRVFLAQFSHRLILATLRSTAIRLLVDVHLISQKTPAFVAEKLTARSATRTTATSILITHSSAIRELNRSSHLLTHSLSSPYGSPCLFRLTLLNSFCINGKNKINSYQ